MMVFIHNQTALTFWYEPADKILDRKKGRDYVYKEAKGKGNCNV